MFKEKIMNSQRLQVVFSLLMAGLMFAGDAWSAQAGRVQFVNGDVEVTTAAGVTHAAHKGDPVNEGDTITSAKTASAQIKMQDGGFIAVRPDTKLKFDSFKFGGKAGEPENSFFSLFKGGFRAVTGLIGRIRKDDYHITTPVATIGIRGTDHETVLVLPDNPLVASGQAEPGAYNKVSLGETIITTDKGTVNVFPNQMGFAGGLNLLPEIKPINTNLFTVVPQPLPGSGEGENQGIRETAVVDPDLTNPIEFDSEFVLSGIIPPTVIPVMAVGQDNPTGTNLNFLAVEFYIPGDTIILVPNMTGVTTTFDAQGLLTAVGAQSYSRNTATSLESGSDGGVIAWGRWTEGAPSLGSLGTMTYPYGLAYLVGTPVTSVPTGTYTYAYIGGTHPTEAPTSTINVWSVVNSGSNNLIANFGAGSVSANLELAMSNPSGSSTYYLHFTSTSFSATGLNPMSGSVPSHFGASDVCSSSGCVASGTVIFAGATATHAGLAYEMGPTYGNPVLGVAAFKRP